MRPRLPVPSRFLSLFSRSRTPDALHNAALLAEQTAKTLALLHRLALLAGILTHLPMKKRRGKEEEEKREADPRETVGFLATWENFELVVAPRLILAHRYGPVVHSAFVLASRLAELLHHGADVAPLSRRAPRLYRLDLVLMTSGLLKGCELFNCNNVEEALSIRRSLLQEARALFIVANDLMAMDGFHDKTIRAAGRRDGLLLSANRALQIIDWNLADHDDIVRLCLRSSTVPSSIQINLVKDLREDLHDVMADRERGAIADTLSQAILEMEELEAQVCALSSPLSPSHSCRLWPSCPRSSRSTSSLTWMLTWARRTRRGWRTKFWATCSRIFARLEPSRWNFEARSRNLPSRQTPRMGVSL